jgi:saccharopine dehydrogenase-like NADP-dependent oxidoreductase
MSSDFINLNEVNPPPRLRTHGRVSHHLPARQPKCNPPSTQNRIHIASNILEDAKKLA